jgi:hypothetical protein
MKNEVRIGLIAVAMVVAIGGRGCVTAPPPTADSLVAGAPKPVTRSSASLTSGDAAAPAESMKAAPSTVAPPDGGESAPQTAEERRAALDKQLNDSLGTFDARLHEEQQKTAEERDARQATVATQGAGSSQGADDAGVPATEVPSGSRSGKRNARGESKTSRAGDLKSDQAAGINGSASGNGAPATVISDGNDDDIVARRIRKAAELETDPELKDKLWKEYVEYKKNAQVR